MPLVGCMAQPPPDRGIIWLFICRSIHTINVGHQALHFTVPLADHPANAILPTYQPHTGDTMKSLKVTINLEMEIPDDWNIIDHPDGVPVLNIGNGNYMYMSFLPMFTRQVTPESEWTSECSDEFAQEIVDMVQGEEVAMKVIVN